MGWHSKEKENLESALGESTLLILQLGKQYNLRMLLNVIKGAMTRSGMTVCLKLLLGQQEINWREKLDYPRLQLYREVD
ncbi:conserved hypothetical protein [Ricinus communis]|uniref:Uncharacterized protein n=1 Tax=Ricinus communis TaxID=3988 RepID=B9SPU7_RICCO|nr:conserved hypothetical protein [Ricinus communis]